MLNFVAVSTVLIVSSALNINANSTTNLRLSLTLGKQTGPFETGDGIFAKLTVTNIGIDRVVFSTFGLPLKTMKFGSDDQFFRQGMMMLTHDDCLTTHCQEQWMGAIVLDRPQKCTQPNKWCISLDSKQSIEQTINLPKYFTFSRNGTYHFQIHGILFDYVSKTKRTTTPVVSSNILSFQFHQNLNKKPIPNAMELGTLRDMQYVDQTTEKQYKGIGKNVDGSGCGTVNVPLSYSKCGTSNTVSTQTIKESVYEAAKELVNKNWHNTYIFGSSSDWSKVDDTYTNIVNALCQSGNTRVTSLTFECDAGCTAYAYVYPAQRNALTVYLCQLYFKAPAKGLNSQMGTVVHEWSHFNQIGGTDDYAYGCSGCRQLSTELKRNNADNYEYAIEDGC